MYGNICVLFGGLSLEREISINSSTNVINGLKELGCKNIFAFDAVDDFISSILQRKPDIAFIALHGKYGEDGCVQGLLEYMGIPYTHSSVLACAQAMHKPTANFILKNKEIAVPDNFVFFASSEMLPFIDFEFPCILKPTSEGSSIGLNIINNASQKIEKKMIGQEMMIEKFIEGRELTVGIINGTALCVMEILHHGKVFDFKKKYERSLEVEYLLDPNIPNFIKDLAIKYAELSFAALGCSGIARIDFIFDEKRGKLFLIEVNTHPGLSDKSIFPKMLKYCGIKFSDMLDFLLKDALYNFRLKKHAHDKGRKNAIVE